MYLLNLLIPSFFLIYVNGMRNFPSTDIKELKPNELSHFGRVDVGKIDIIEANSLYESEEVLNKLILATKRQQELKEIEINIKAAIGSNLHKLNAISELLQMLIEKTSIEINGVVTELKSTVKESEKTKNMFLVQQNYKVVPTKKLPLAEYSESELDTFSKFSAGGEYHGLDCPLSCSPSSCDNKPKESTHCFRAETLKDGSFTSNCVPFTNPKTLTCPKGFIRCALSQPSRGNLYEILKSAEMNPEYSIKTANNKKRSIAISGRNMHQCLRLLVVSKKTSCNIENIFAAVDESRQLIVPNGNSVFPIIKGDVALFENVQVKKAGRFQLCLLQFYQDPNISGGEGARIMGSDSIGELNVLNEDGEIQEDFKSNNHEEKTKVSEEYKALNNVDSDIKDEKGLSNQEGGEKKLNLLESSDRIESDDKNKSHWGVFWYVLPIILILFSSGAGFAYYYYLNNKEFVHSKIISLPYFGALLNAPNAITNENKEK
ncbi:rhoptry neck RON6 [Cryptosporidium sp. chipmunk genotype I]|uniref:rhoptry neck RON6 n=1 Tax=Cryptosporidium sp. chipmunk genotype I TaxID=1280935 RepID=UPI00351A005A|nr:rhoptry neck RON6 [Cryptosporidium sp. chipmunk genotype I]